MTEFEEAFTKYQGNMYRALRKMGIPHSLAQDSVQEAGQKLSQMGTISYVEPHRVKGLFCEVARNCAIDRIRQDNRLRSVHEEHENRRLTAKQKMDKKERERIISITVHRALSRLTDIESYVSWRYYALQMSLREIQEDLSKYKNIDWELTKIHRFLRKIVKPKLKRELMKLGADKI